jgi:hypothetical protein
MPQRKSVPYVRTAKIQLFLYRSENFPDPDKNNRTRNPVMIGKITDVPDWIFSCTRMPAIRGKRIRKKITL